MNYILFDDESRDDLLPLTFTRPIADIRIGILTIREKWENFLSSTVSHLTQEYLQLKFPFIRSGNDIYINGSVLPNKDLVDVIRNLLPGYALMDNEILIAVHFKSDAKISRYKDIKYSESFEYKGPYLKLNHVWDIFTKNAEAMEADFEILTKGRDSKPISNTNKVIGKNRIFLEESAVVEYAIINTNSGPVYIGKDAEVMEGTIIRGPFALCDHSTLKLGTKIYGPTTIGPHSKIGGEVNNSVVFGYSNKAHDGFLGNSVIGEWCNLGADTNNSNLKNNYSSIKIWNYKKQDYIDTGLTFCGLIMGDHSKCGINTMFNTGTVVGLSANIFGGGFPSKFIPSFAWGGAEGFTEFRLEQAIEVAERVYARRSKELNENEKNILTEIFKQTQNVYQK